MPVLRLSSLRSRLLAPLTAAGMAIAVWGCPDVMELANSAALRPDGVKPANCHVDLGLPSTAEFEQANDACLDYTAPRGCVDHYLTNEPGTECHGFTCDPASCGPGAEDKALAQRPPSKAGSRRGTPVRFGATVAASERNALLALYNSTAGPSWFDRDNWGGAPGTECTWEGVTCSDDGSTVTGLYFHYANLRGNVPSQLHDLAHLQTLSISESSALTFDSDALAIPSLRSLDLEALPWSTLAAAVTNASGLHALDLVDMHGLTALPDAIGQLHALDHLTLDDLPSVKALPASLGSLPLHGLTVRATGLTALPSWLPSATHLTRLVISDDTALKGTFPDLGNLASLQILTVEQTALTGTLPASLGNLHALTALTVRANPGLGGAIPPTLGNLAALQGLQLGSNALTGAIPTALGSLSSLLSLDLSLNKLSGPIPTSLGNLGHLQTLMLSGNQLTGGLPPLGGLTNLRLLSAGGNQLSGPLPADLLDARTLQVIFLRANRFTGDLPDLSALPALTHLNLSDNPFTPGPVPAWVNALPVIQNLALAGTNRNGDIPSLTGLADTLTYLGLDDNAFTAGPVPSWIPSLTKLTGLGLGNTNRNGAIPSFLADMDTLQYVDLSANPFTAAPLPAFFNRDAMPRLQDLDLSRDNLTGPIPASMWTLGLSRLRLAGNQLSGPLSADVQRPLLQLLDLSHNQLSGALPMQLGTQTGISDMNLAGNAFTGPVPTILASSVLDEDMLDGPLTTPYNEKLIGIDLRYNALTATDANLLALLQKKEGDDFRATQTVAPGGGRAISGKGSLKVSWTPIPFTAAGTYVIEIARSAAGPFTTAATVARTASSATVNGLKRRTKYYFRIYAATPPTANNANALRSLPSAVFTGTPR